MIRVLVAALALCLSTCASAPVFAQPRPVCLTPPMFMAILKKAEGKVIGGTAYAGETTDLIIIYIVDDRVLGAQFGRGCMLPPTRLDMLRRSGKTIDGTFG